MNEEYDPAVHHGILCRQALSPTSSRSRRVLPDASVFSEDPGRDADASAVSSPFGNRPRPDRDECFPLPSFLRRVLLRLTQPPVRAASPDPDRTFLENMIDEHSARDLAAFDRRWVSSGPVGLGSMGTVSVVRRREDGTPRRRRRRNGDADPSSASSTSGTASCASDATPERPEDGRAFALKTVRTERASPAFTKELRNEVEILRGLDHPNIVRPVEVFETGAAADRRLFLVMELCSGEPRVRGRFVWKPTFPFSSRLFFDVWSCFLKHVCFYLERWRLAFQTSLHRKSIRFDNRKGSVGPDLHALAKYNSSGHQI
mmetsp:Transcript_39620/g.92698  ORF Transcript_39620/g.92698 Transcript_39620/m.92698 type:complete len:316 (-) Transcript_39620:1274-2221(-)